MINIGRIYTLNLVVLFIAILSFVEIPNVPIPLSVAVMFIMVLSVRYFKASYSIISIFYAATFVELLKLHFFGCPEFVLKSIISIIVFMLILNGLRNIVERTKITNRFTSEIKIITRLITLIIFVDVCLDMLITGSIRPSGILFYEPSHLGFILTPILVFFILEKQIVYAVLSLFTLFLAFSSTTLLVIFLSLVLIYSPYLKRALVSLKLLNYHIFLIATIIPIFIFFFTNPEFVSRLVGVLAAGQDDEKNMSSIVYLNGWLQAIEYLKGTYGFGVGIANMGCSGGIITPLSPIVEELSNGLYLNYNDGSFLISKMLSELGIVVTICIVLYLFKVNFRVIRYVFQNRNDLKKRTISHLMAAFVISNTLYLFLRGAGYFESQVLFIIIGVQWLNKLELGKN
jgi:hypothetical protein